MAPEPEPDNSYPGAREVELVLLMLSQALISLQGLLYLYLENFRPGSTAELVEALSKDEYALYSLIPLVLFPAVDAIAAVQGHPRARNLGFAFLLLLYSVALYLGGGWVVGTLFGCAGVVLEWTRPTPKVETTRTTTTTTTTTTTAKSPGVPME
ncbi:MAG: hypothetical protein ACTSU5_11785 [Promethearchaeota archaeon]